MFNLVFFWLNKKGSPQFLITDTCIKRWGLRASSLSAVTKANAGQNTSCNHLNPNVLYMMLPAVIYIFLSIKYSIHTQHFINVFNVLFLSSLIFSIQYSFLHCQQNFVFIFIKYWFILFFNNFNNL